MFTNKPEADNDLTKSAGGLGNTETPRTKRLATYPAKSFSLSVNKLVPSIIGEDLTIKGNVTCKGEIQVDGNIQGEIHCSSLLLGDKAHVKGGIVAEDVVLRGHLMGTIRGVRITLQAPSHVEGDIFHQSLAIEQGAHFEGKSRRSDNPLAEISGANSSARSRSGSAESSSSESSRTKLPPVAAE